MTDIVGRGLISDNAELLVSPLPSQRFVPGMLLDDDLYVSLSAAMDDLIAPTLVGMDCMPAYLDAQLTPEDFLPWLASLVGAEPTGPLGHYDPDGLRVDIAQAVANYARAGTVDGLRQVAASAARVQLDAVDIEDPGGVSWSSEAAAVPLGTTIADTDHEFAKASPPAPTPVVTVRVRTGSDAEVETVATVVATELERVRPVHCELRVEVTR